ncbi:alpha/beta-hydrolase [Dichomitus squalens]|uniref:Alpha/beta-hydrolase n=1 Tax=Dichomitus squalens TaxID=114155 RepID=A0A4V2K0X8_9APHY|nr:alpha/beta-hydrolase [Dichomitus squalens]
MTMAKLLEYQPFKAVYLVYSFGTFILVKIPAWFFSYVSPSRRPRPTWTIRRSLIIRSFQELQELFTVKIHLQLSHRDPLQEVLDSSLTDAKFVWLEPIPDDSPLFCGEIRRFADITGVKPAKIAGYWFLRRGSAWNGPNAQPGEKVVLHMHGGAFCIGTAHPSDMTANISRGLLEYSGTLQRTFSVDFRLTASAPNPPANPFPAAVLDSLAAYRYLVQDCGFEPKNVVFAGDSAGGNIALALVRHLIENELSSLPPPRALFLSSAWLDLMGSRDGPESSRVQNALSDIFSRRLPKGEFFAQYAITSLRGSLDLDVVKTNRYFSPAAVDAQPPEGSTLFKGFPETYVTAGGAERFSDDSKALVERMKADSVVVHEDFSPDAVHDFLIFNWHEPERTEVFKRVCSWIDSL